MRPDPATSGSPAVMVNYPIEDAQMVPLPGLRLSGDMSVEESLRYRRSVREYGARPLTLAEVSQLLWAAQGVTSSEGGRTAPSAGPRYPLETYLVAGHVSGLETGVYRYRPSDHDLLRVGEGDRRELLAGAALGQEWVANGTVLVVIAAVYERTKERYGDRGVEYVHMERGHAAQNLHLQAVALGLGSVPVAGFHREQVSDILGLSVDEEPLYIIPVGPPRE